LRLALTLRFKTRAELLSALDDAISAVRDLCERYDVALDELRQASGFAFIALRDASARYSRTASSSNDPTNPEGGDQQVA
jgi:hypothetical protein